MAEKKKVFKHNEFVWKSLRIAFWIMIGTFLISLASDYMATWLINIISVTCYISIIFVFIVSIIHLTKYKEKGFAVTALVISSLIIFALFLGILVIMAQYSATV